VNHSRTTSLPTPLIATDKNRHLPARSAGLLADSHHLRLAAESSNPQSLVAVIAQRLILSGQLFLLPRLQHRASSSVFKRFRQIIVRPNANGFYDRANFVRAPTA